MQTLADAGVSTAIFAPAWTHEHFSAELNGLESISDKVNRSMWEGCTLPEQLLCDCKGRPHHTSSYQLHSILKSSIQYPAGSATFFYTDFSPAFQISSCDSATRSEIFPHLGIQSIYPSRSYSLSLDQHTQHMLPLSADAIHTRFSGNEENEGMSLSIKLRHSIQDSSQGIRRSSEEHRLCLYNVAIECREQLRLQMVYTLSEFQDSEHSIVAFGLYLSILTGSGLTHYEYIPLESELCSRSSLDYAIQQSSTKSSLLELGVYCRCRPVLAAIELFQCHSLSIIPMSALTSIPELQFSITEVRITRIKVLDKEQGRLEWNWTGDRDAWPTCLPLSGITGPFSHFVVLKDGKKVGVSQSLAFPLDVEEFEPDQKRNKEAMTFTVKGFCFAGVVLDVPAVASLRIE